jgi:glyoxylase-like metal-dependent hydrolase (beta-lactamase superfamily II)
MRTRLSLAVVATALVGVAAWYGTGAPQSAPRPGAWTPVVPGVLRAPGPIAGYALVADDEALLIDAPAPADGLAAHGVRKVAGVLLTHYHRELLTALPDRERVSVRAPKKAEAWLHPDKVRKYWQDSLPLCESRTAYRVHPTGFDGIDCSLTDRQTIDWRGWKITVVDTPGSALAHVAYVAQKAGGPRVVFCGGAFTAAGKLWAPYTTDWDHWTEAGLKPAAESLRRLIAQKPAVLCPAHGPVVTKAPAAALGRTLAHVEEVGFLKSFERYTKQRVGNAPQYEFLVKEQAESNGSKPWSRVSDHLYLTGNTYVLTSKDEACLMFDPWARRGADQYARLEMEKQLGPLEVVMFSHAHFDHYDGVYHLPGRPNFEVWALDAVARPIAEPFRWRAPFLDARPVTIDRRPRDGETLAWREYRFRFHFLPGQSLFTMGVETTVDGKRGFFTADNFFHQDMYSGSGGWMGLNRSSPLRYAESAQKVLDARPDWVLAEHGGPFTFDAEDFRRRVAWGRAAATAADALSPSGQHLKDWDPHRVHVEPLLQKARPGDTTRWALVAENPTAGREELTVTLEGRGLVEDRRFDLKLPEGGQTREAFALELPRTLTAGRHVFAVRAESGGGLDGSDAFLVVDVEP